mmetsp:Transcript_16452/g.23048  ORF Transcript_16452/g.23048 Transcript_16452/m.23048 type:complete len:374 (+) Transcript_16452:154-1275(+)
MLIQEAMRNKQINRQLSLEAKQGRLHHKLLLLGAGESGKSTFLKQLIRIHDKGYDLDARKAFTQSIYKNILSSIQSILEAMETNGWELDEKLGDALNVFKEEVKKEENSWTIDEEVGDAVKTLWKDKGVRDAFSKRDLPEVGFYLFDGAEYFFNKIDTIKKDDYTPDEEDIVRCRIRTSGIVEKGFDIKGNHFRVFDVGGQRAERRKWIHCFQNVTAVMFIASLSSYNQNLFEDQRSNRMTEAILLFEDISNSHWFQETAMILFLNKYDIFKEKVQKVSINHCPSLQNFKGKGEEESLAYIQMVFETSCQNPLQSVYTHFTTATDKRNVESIFDAVQDIVIRKSMAEAGLLVESSSYTENDAGSRILPGTYIA